MSLLRVLIAVLLLIAVARTAIAHDTGFGHSKRTLLVAATPEAFLLEYRLTAGADEVLIEMTLMDTDADGQISPEEADRHFTALAQKLAANLKCRTPAGKPLVVEPLSHGLGASLTQTFRFRVSSTSREIFLTDLNFPHKPGQIRIIRTPGVQVDLTESIDLTHAERLPLSIRRDPPGK